MREDNFFEGVLGWGFAEYGGFLWFLGGKDVVFKCKNVVIRVVFCGGGNHAIFIK